MIQIFLIKFSCDCIMDQGIKSFLKKYILRKKIVRIEYPKYLKMTEIVLKIYINVFRDPWDIIRGPKSLQNEIRGKIMLAQSN